MNHHFNVEIAKQYGIEEAIIIENLYFWIKKNVANESNKYDGRYWTYNSAKAFAEIFSYMSARKISRVLDSLSVKEAILKGNYNELSFDRTMWYSFSDKLLYELDKQKYDVNKMSDTYDLTKVDNHLPKMSNGSCENDKPIPYNNPNNKQQIKEEKDKSFSEKDEFLPFADEPQTEYEKPKTKKQIAQEIADFWNENKPQELAAVRIVTKERISAIQARLNSGFTIDDIKKAILLTNSLSDFYKGKEKGKTWKATLDWLINNTNNNFVLILEGALHTTDEQKIQYDRVLNAKSVNGLKKEYRPILGDSIFWNEKLGVHIFIGYIEDLHDGYTDENRPNGATLFQNGYTFVWDSTIKKWVKQ